MSHQSRLRITSAAILIALALSLCGLPVGIPDQARGQATSDASAALRAAAALYEGIRTETLANGLRVYLKPIPGSPVVTTMVAYKVGSADENLNSTGLSHYLEHLMFKGTDKLMPGDIDRQTLRSGGQNNAYTTEDLTNYHFNFAADRWEVALEIEADRMRNLRIDDKHEFQKEKGAVIAELEADEDNPWDLEQKAILPLLFAKGPYGHPVIGEREHVREATAEIIKSHYDTWYHPNNAVLVVCGGFDPDKAFAKIEQLFGSIPAGKLPARKPPVAVTRSSQVQKTITSKFESPRMLMGFNGVSSGAPGYYALEVIQGILAGGKTGRLYKKLVEQFALASSVNAGNQAGRYPGWFVVQVEMLAGKNRDLAEKAVVDELRLLQDKAVDPAELARAKREMLASAVFGRESVHGLADSIVRGVCTNDLEFLKSYLPRIQAVTAQEVQDAARKFLKINESVVLWSVPPKPGAQGSGDSKPGASDKKRSSRVAGADGTPRHSGRADEATGAGAAAFSIKDARRHVLPNGITLILLENHRLPIVVADVSVRNVSLLEPEEKSGVAALVGSLLDEGTDQHSGAQIAEMIENVGGSLDLHSGGGSVKVLSEDQALGIGLLFECLTRPTFPADAFQRKKDQHRSVLEDTEHQPNVKAQRVFKEIVYGKHPFGRVALGSRKTLDALTVNDCKAFHRRVFVPNNTIAVVVGDFDSQKKIEEIKNLTKDWKWSTLMVNTPPPAPKQTASVEKVLSMADAAQLHLYLGHLGIKRGEGDFYRLLVMDHILGTGAGFTDRLSSRLRDREGLAYTVTANITSSATEEPGMFTCYIGIQPKNLGHVKKAFLEEIHRLRNDLPTKEEVEDVKKYLLGSLPFKVATSDRVAGLLLSIERFNLGLNYLEDYRKEIESITPEDVRAVARKYLDPEHMVLVVAGPVDEKGQPLKAKPNP